MADIGTTLTQITAAAPELAKTPLLTLGLAQEASRQNYLTLDPGPANRATAQTTALSLILLGMKNAAIAASQVNTQPREPEPLL